MAELEIGGQPYRYTCTGCGSHQVRRNATEPTVYCNGCGHGYSSVRDKKRAETLELR